MSYTQILQEKSSEGNNQTREDESAASGEVLFLNKIKDEKVEQEHAITVSKMLENKDRRYGIWLKVIYSAAIPVGVGCWVWSVLNFVKDCCSLEKCSHYYASDNVLIALVGGTSASVLTLLILIVKHLFPGVREQK